MRLFNIEVKFRTSQDEDLTPSMSEAEVRRIMQATHDDPDVRTGKTPWHTAFNQRLIEAFDTKQTDPS